MAPGMAKDAGEGGPAKKVRAKGKAKSAKPAARPYERPRGGEARSISDLVPEIGRTAFRKFGFIQSSVVSRWREIVGDHYAGATAPESIRFAPGKRDDGVLTLTVDSGFAVMVQHVAPEIIERVNRFFGYRAVARLVIRQGRVEARPAPPARSALRPAPAEMTEGLRAIADPGLRASLESLAARVSASEGPPRFAGDRPDHDDKQSIVPFFPGPIGKVS